MTSDRSAATLGAVSAEQDICVRGSLHASNGVGWLRIEIHVPARLADVWTAVSTPAGLARWAGEVEGDLHLGGAYRARLFPSGWDGTGHVLECTPGRRFLIESAEPGQAPKTDEVALEPEGDGTRITWVKRGVPADMVAVYAVGTQIHLENLAAALAGRVPVDPEPFWAELLPQYEQLPVEG